MSDPKYPEKNHKCPVCGQYYFQFLFDECPVCNWAYDPPRHGNDMSLNQANQAYKDGKEIL